MTMWMWGVLAVTGLAAYVALAFYCNRHQRPIIGPIAPDHVAPDLPDASTSLSVMTWNIGYAGLGKNADLVVDNGTSIRALPADEIGMAAHEVAGWLASRPCDVICLQENANAGFLTRRQPLRSIIDAALSNRVNLFWSDMKSVIVPRFLQIDHGMSVHAHVKLQSCHAASLPQDDVYFSGILKKHYGALVCRFAMPETGRDWVVINVHLSAFDTEGHARQGQVATLMRLARQEYEKGNFIVIGGDWNMRLAQTDFPHQADHIDLSWVTDFPDDVLSDGWQLAVDKATPTVRSLNAAYQAGETYTTIVDGFVCSPNVAIKRVATTNQDFRLSDHHPVEAHFKARA